MVPPKHLLLDVEINRSAENNSIFISLHILQNSIYIFIKKQSIPQYSNNPCLFLIAITHPSCILRFFTAVKIIILR